MSPSMPRGQVMLNIFVKYILLFKYVALNKATHAVYYDLVNFADYDQANIETPEAQQPSKTPWGWPPSTAKSCRMPSL